MKACVFVDGENFRYSIRDLFKNDTRKKAHFDYLPICNWKLFFDHIAGECFGAERFRTYWYTVAKVIFTPNAINDVGQEIVNSDGTKTNKLEKIIRAHGSKEQIADIPATIKAICERQDTIQRRFDGWKKQEDGIALNTECLEFRRTGIIKFDLLTDKFESEKEVDVQLATDLLELRQIYDVAVLISGDQDFVPAVKVIKNSGKRVINVSFKTRSGKYLPGGAYILNLVCDKTLCIDYSKLESLIFN